MYSVHLSKLENNSFSLSIFTKTRRSTAYRTRGSYNQKNNRLISREIAPRISFYRFLFGTPDMTSNRRFAQYVERVQESLAIFSLPDRRAKTFLRKSDPIAGYKPSFLVFEILINDQPRNAIRPVRMFDPHVSEQLLEGFTVESAMGDVERLAANAQFLRECGRPIDWQNVDWTVDDDPVGKFSTLAAELQFVFDVRDRLLGNLNQPERALNALEQSIPPIDVEGNREDLEKVRDTLKKLVRRYEREYIPTNLAASGLIYEAWKTGKLQPFGNPESDEDKFNKLIDGLFVYTEEGSNAQPLHDMARNLGVDYLTDLGVSLLDSGEVWAKVPPQPWFTCVESSLIYRNLIVETPPDTYVIHFPLVIDNYRFVGFCYLYATIKQGQEPSDIFVDSKYPKFYYAIQAVSETLRFSLRADALAKVEACLDRGEEDTDAIFAEVIQNYVVCFDVASKEGGSANSTKQDPLNNTILYEGHGVKIYGPSWVSDSHKKLLSDEIDGASEQLGFYSIPGLYQDVNDRIEHSRREREQGLARGMERQSNIFSHQAAGLVAEVWCDPEISRLADQSQGCLWQLKTLVDLWGNFNIEANLSLSEGSRDFPERWRQMNSYDLLIQLVDIAIGHALRRATYQRPGGNSIDRAARRKAFELGQTEDPIAAFKAWVGLEILAEGPERPVWLDYRGFVVCFHHSFWQAAFHGFRSRCSSQESAQDSDCYVRIAVDDACVHISNRKVPGEDAQDASRDGNFYKERLVARLEEYFKITGPREKENIANEWEVIIEFREQVRSLF